VGRQAWSSARRHRVTVGMNLRELDPAALKRIPEVLSGGGEAFLLLREVEQPPTPQFLLSVTSGLFSS